MFLEFSFYVFVNCKCFSWSGLVCSVLFADLMERDFYANLIEWLLLGVLRALVLTIFERWLNFIAIVTEFEADFELR